MNARSRGLVAALLMLGSGSEAVACPVCDSPTGAKVRAGVADGFAANLAVAAAPFLAVGAVAALVHFYPGRPRRTGDGD